MRGTAGAPDTPSASAIARCPDHAAAILELSIRVEECGDSETGVS